MKTKTKIIIGVVCFAAVAALITVPYLQHQAKQSAPSTSAVSSAPYKLSITGFCVAGCPTGASPRNTMITHHILELSNNPDTKFADWVAYKISADTIAGHCKRTWKEDPDLDPDTTLGPRDYKGIQEIHFDRGHQAPLASLCGSPYWAEADYLSNITPQATDLNEGEWEHLENAERRLVQDYGVSAVYTITGPLYEKDEPQLPNARVPTKTPSGYWKIVTIIVNGQVEAAGFVMPQEASRNSDYCAEQRPVSDISNRAHLNFYTEMPLADRQAIYKMNSVDLVAKLGCR